VSRDSELGRNVSSVAKSRPSVPHGANLSVAGMLVILTSVVALRDCCAG